VRTGRFNSVLLAILLIVSVIALAMPLLPSSPAHAALAPHAPIYIDGNAGFTKPDPVNGGGSGTIGDPYISTGDTYDVDALGIPKFVWADYIELEKIHRISRFRSAVGHDYSDDFESCRSMKHYFEPRSDVNWSTIRIFSPVDGTVDALYEEWAGTQVRIKSYMYPAFFFIIFHVNLTIPLYVGSSVYAGQELGTHIGFQTMSDIAVGVTTPRGWKLVSYFDVMTDSLFQDYQTRGVSSRDAAIISKEERDADPLTCTYCPGGNFTSTGSLQNWVTLEVKPKLYIVYDIGGRGDLSFNDMAYMGGKRAEQELGVELVEMHSATEADYVPNLRAAASDLSTKLVVGVGFLLNQALIEVAKEFPDKNFVGIDTSTKWIEPQPNLLDVVFEEHNGSALVGALAAMLAYHYEKPYVGAVLGIEFSVLWKFEIGYKWGAEYWAPTWYRQRFGEWPPMVDTLWTYTGTFSDITKGYEAAKPMYAQGAVAVYNIAGPLGLGINQAVKEIAESEGLEDGPPFWIGVDADQDWINPGFVIASMMKRVDRGVYYATQLVMENKFRDAVAEYGNQITLGIGTTVLGIPMEGISVSTLEDLDAFMEMGIEAGIIGPENRDAIYTKVKAMRDNQPAWIWEAVAELEEKIRTGEVEVPMVMTGDTIAYWRDIFEKLPAPAYIGFIPIGTTAVDARDETDTAVTINTNQAGSVTVIKYEDNPGGTPPSGFTALGKYIEVLTDISSGNINWPIEIRIYYTHSEIAAAGISENSLKIYYWDGNTWVEEADSGVNMGNNYVWARVSHLSPFAPMGSRLAAPVGGVAFPADKLALLAPWIILAVVIAIVTISVAVYWRRQ